MVERKKLGDICEVLDSQRRPVSKGNRNKGYYPYYGANGIQDYVDSYIFDGTYLLMGEDGSVINKDNSPVLHWATGKIWVNNHAHILQENRNASLRYLFYSLQCIDVSDIVRGVPPKINQANMRNILIPVPSLSEQKRIVGILDTFTASIDNLKEQIAQRRKQYEYYRDQLLDLEGKEGVEMKTLGEISTFSQGIQVPLENQSLANKEGYFRFLRIIDFTQGNEPPRYVPISDKRYWISSDEIAIVRYGTPGFVCRGLEGILANNMFKVIIKDKGLLGNSFLSSLLKSKIFQTPIKQKSSGGALQAISFGLIKDISVPVPPLQEQQRIVSILDTFEASIQNLEAQLEQREKQYEYYRNKLLTFE